MKQTLLQMTQDILSALSSDEVNSIGDTTESLQVATIIKQKYFDIINRVPMPDQQLLIQLDPSLDITSPVLMYVPEGIAEIKWLKYFDTNILDNTMQSNYQHDLNVDITSTSGGFSNAPPGYLNVDIIPNKAFIDMVSGFNPDEPWIESFLFSNTDDGKEFKFYYRNDRTPTYCTIIKNYYVIFDSYDATQDDTLQASKTMAKGQRIPVFKMEDNFIPELPEDQFQLLFNEAKLLAFFELKQQPHQLAERETQRGWSNVQKTKAIADRPTYFDALPDYGRFGRGGYGVPRYFKLRGFDR